MRARSAAADRRRGLDHLQRHRGPPADGRARPRHEREHELRDRLRVQLLGERHVRNPRERNVYRTEGSYTAADTFKVAVKAGGREVLQERTLVVYTSNVAASGAARRRHEPVQSIGARSPTSSSNNSEPGFCIVLSRIWLRWRTMTRSESMQQWERAEIARSSVEATLTADEALRVSRQTFDALRQPPRGTAYPLEYAYHVARRRRPASGSSTSGAAPARTRRSSPTAAPTCGASTSPKISSGSPGGVSR